MSVYEIELDNTNANQEFDVSIDEIDNSVHIVLRTVNAALLMTVSVNSEVLGEPFLCLPNQEIIPYQYMVDTLGGNFLFTTEDDNYPNYENFGDTCRLFFVTSDEIEG